MNTQRRQAASRNSLSGSPLGIILAGVTSLTMAIGGCTASTQTGDQPVLSADLSPYETEMLQRGFVELVGDDLLPPVLPPNASQAERGAVPYTQICLACHGDWGQGLSDGWRAEWGEDANCWQSRCHAPNHPPSGFRLPKTVPPLLGAGSLASYSTAADLYQNISLTMPWWNPGSLSEDQSWTLTAFLMRSRGEINDDVTLDHSNGPIYRLHADFAPPADPRIGTLVLVAVLGVGAIALIKRHTPPS